MRINKYLFIRETFFTSKLLLNVYIFLLSFSIIFKKNDFICIFYQKNFNEGYEKLKNMRIQKHLYIIIFHLFDNWYIINTSDCYSCSFKYKTILRYIYCIRYSKNAIQCRENISIVKTSIDLSFTRYISTRESREMHSAADLWQLDELGRKRGTLISRGLTVNKNVYNFIYHTNIL